LVVLTLDEDPLSMRIKLAHLGCHVKRNHDMTFMPRQGMIDHAVLSREAGEFGKLGPSLAQDFEVADFMRPPLPGLA
jgi:hypothetical protein